MGPVTNAVHDLGGVKGVMLDILASSMRHVRRRKSKLEMRESVVVRLKTIRNPSPPRMIDGATATALPPLSELGLSVKGGVQLYHLATHMEKQAGPVTAHEKQYKDHAILALCRLQHIMR